MAVKSPLVSTSDESDSSYKLDPEQTLKASKALLHHLKLETEKIQQNSNKRSLAAQEGSDEDEGDDQDIQPVWLNLATKQHIVDKNRLKPSKIAVPHTLNTSENLTICLITTDPQRAIKNAVADPTFPFGLSSNITKIIGLQKLSARYKTFESRRQLLSEHDVFLADERIILRLPKILGKVFYKGTAKRPIPISIAPRKAAEDKPVGKPKVKKEAREAEVAPPLIIAAEIERALSCIPVSLKPGTNVSVRIGLASFTPEALADNIHAVVPKLIEKHVVKGWRNVKSVNIKSATSFSIPLWLSDDLWAEDDAVADAVVVTEELADKQGEESVKRKRNPGTTKGPQTGARKKAKLEAEKSNGEQRKQRLATQKAKLFNPT